MTDSLTDRFGRLDALDRPLDCAGVAEAKQHGLALLELLYTHFGGIDGRPSIDNSDAQRAALAALGHSGAAAVRPWISPFADHPNYHIRAEALARVVASYRPTLDRFHAFVPQRFTRSCPNVSRVRAATFHAFVPQCFTRSCPRISCCADGSAPEHSAA